MEDKKNFRKPQFSPNLFSGIDFSTANSSDTLKELDIANPEELIGTVILDKYVLKSLLQLVDLALFIKYGICLCINKAKD